MSRLRRIDRWLSTPVRIDRSRVLFLLALGFSYGSIIERLTG